MPEKDEKDREPWTPRLDRQPLFTNSADYERSLAEGSGAPDIDTAEEGSEEIGEAASAAVPDPILKPAP
jgi:hypothetical protein